MENWPSKGTGLSLVPNPAAVTSSNGWQVTSSPQNSDGTMANPKRRATVGILKFAPAPRGFFGAVSVDDRLLPDGSVVGGGQSRTRHTIAAVVDGEDAASRPGSRLASARRGASQGRSASAGRKQIHSARSASQGRRKIHKRKRTLSPEAAGVDVGKVEEIRERWDIDKPSPSPPRESRGFRGTSRSPRLALQQIGENDEVFDKGPRRHTMLSTNPRFGMRCYIEVGCGVHFARKRLGPLP